MIETYDYDSDVICVITSESSLNDWVLDSKCCFYICATKGLFDSYNLVMMVMLSWLMDQGLRSLEKAKSR